MKILLLLPLPPALTQSAGVGLADGASAVGTKPSIYALNMKFVAARECSQRVSTLVLSETNAACCAHLPQTRPAHSLLAAAFLRYICGRHLRRHPVRF